MNEAQRLYAEAVEALNRRQWEAAHAMGLRLVGMVPGHGGVHFVAGVAALQLQRLPEGVRHLQRAVHLSPARADYAGQCARALAMAPTVLLCDEPTQGVDVGVRRQDFQLIGDLEHFVHDKLHVAQGRVVLGHGDPLALSNVD